MSGALARAGRRFVQATRRRALGRGCTLEALLADCDAARREVALRELAVRREQHVAAPEEVYLAALFCGVRVCETGQTAERAPVVAVLGHVDHGKTTLLDFYRGSEEARHEVGGITQRVGGFTLRTPHGPLSFVDTPGHEVFANMRRSGAGAADVGVVVVSGVEGVQRQTEEALAVLAELALPFVVAVSKIDLPAADVHAVEEQLVDRGVALAPYGGDVDVVHVSARTGHNTAALAELLCEVGRELRLHSAVGGAPEAVVVAARADGETASATVVALHGELRPGQLLTAGEGWVRVQQLRDWRGRPLAAASRGQIVELVGLRRLPLPGASLHGLPDLAAARAWEAAHEHLARRLAAPAETAEPRLVLDRADRRRLRKNAGLITELLHAQRRRTAESLAAAAEPETRQRLAAELEQLGRRAAAFSSDQPPCPLILRAADRGSLQTVQDVLARRTGPVVTLLRADCGPPTQKDVELAVEAGAAILTFGVAEAPEVFGQMREHALPYANHELVHHLLEAVERLATERAGDALRCVGRARVVRLLTAGGRRGEQAVLGVRVEEGEVRAAAEFRLLRHGVLLREGLHAVSLRHFKAAVAQLAEGEEGGLVLSDQDAVQEQDVLECWA